MKYKKSESGITIVALVTTVVILIILATITINSLKGENGIVDSYSNSIEEYSIENYKEQIYQLTAVIGEKYSINGELVEIEEIADEMAEQRWIKSVISDGDITVVTEDDNVYQVYYNQTDGQVFVEYLGTGYAEDYPPLYISYNKQTGNISVNSNDAQQIELIHNEKSIKTVSDTSLTYLAQETGWYTAKASFDNEKVRYGWVRVSKVQSGVDFTVTSLGTQVNGWYGSDNVPVQVSLNTNADKIYYKLGSAGNYTHVQANNTLVTINTLGKTTIYAYSVDSEGNESEISSTSIKYDNSKPVIGQIDIQGETRENSTSYKSDIVISFPDMTDTGSGIDEYTYWLKDKPNNRINVKDTNKSITVKSNGIKEIAIQVRDKAGNSSNIQTISITKEPIVAGERANKDSIYISEGKEAVIPKGFTVSKKSGESSINDGLVIYRIPVDDTPNDGDNDLTENEIAAINWTNSTVTDNLRKTYDQFVWIPVDTAYVTADEIDEIITDQNYTDDMSGTPMYTARQKAINYLISQGTYPMAVQLNDGINYRSIFYDFQSDSNNITITSGVDFSILASESYDYNETGHKTYYREPGTICYEYDYDENGNQLATSINYNNLTQSKLQQEYNEMIKAVEASKGFWVGRYETSGMHASDDKQADIKIVAGEKPSNSMNWFRMYEQQKKHINNYDGITLMGGMVSGAAWDQMIIFLVQSNYDVTAATNVGHVRANFASSMIPYQTGGTNYSTVYNGTVNNGNYGDIWNNIYDIEGNIVDWTLGVCDNNRRCFGGGNIANEWPCSYLIVSGLYVGSGHEDYGTRMAIYVK